MEENALWQAFAKTGEINDYLRYRQAANAALPPQTKEGGARDTQNRCPHHSGKQGR